MKKETVCCWLSMSKCLRKNSLSLLIKTFFKVPQNLLAIITVYVLEIILKDKHIKFAHYFMSLKQLNIFFSHASGHGNTKHSTENTYLAYENYFDTIKIFFNDFYLDPYWPPIWFYRLHLNCFTDLLYLFNVVNRRSLMICDGLWVLNNEFCAFLIEKHFLPHALTPSFVKLITFL